MTASRDQAADGAPLPEQPSSPSLVVGGIAPPAIPIELDVDSSTSGRRQLSASRDKLRTRIIEHATDRADWAAGLFLDAIWLVVLLLINSAIEAIHKLINPEGFDQFLYICFQVLFATVTLCTVIIYSIGDIIGLYQDVKSRLVGPK